MCVRERETEKGRMRVVTNRDVMSLADTKVIATATTNHRTTLNVTEYRHISESVCQWCDVMLCHVIVVCCTCYRLHCLQGAVQLFLNSVHINAILSLFVVDLVFTDRLSRPSLHTHTGIL